MTTCGRIARHDQVKHLVAFAQKNGWAIGLTSKRHLRFTHPGVKGPVFSSSTPSDWRSSLSAISQLQRCMRAAGLTYERV